MGRKKEANAAILQQKFAALERDLDKAKKEKNYDKVDKITAEMQWERFYLMIAEKEIKDEQNRRA